MSNPKFQNFIEFLHKDISELLKKKKKRGRKSRHVPGTCLARARHRRLWAIGLVLVIFCFGIFAGGFYGQELWQGLKRAAMEVNNYLRIFPEIKPPTTFSQKSGEGQVQPPGYIPQTSQEEAVIRVVQQVSPAVVSIIITKDLPVYEQYYENPFPELPGFPEFQIPQYRQKGTQKQKIGGGTGFIISEDGMVLTNKHVVADTEADYTVITNEGQKYPAKVLARDPFQDLAILKIDKEKIITAEGEFLQKPFSVVRLGDSENLQIGQTVITVGNALGEFRNTVSAGVISGLGRTITASGGGIVETLEDVIQTDAAINKGNSGGPLLNLKGEVIGVNVAMAEAAQSIGFAIPINKAKRDIEQVKTIGKIVYPFLGVRYVLITPEFQTEKDLLVDYGAFIIRGEGAGEFAITPGSAAEKAGLKENDIILEIDGRKITLENSLAEIIREHQPGDKLVLKILRNGKELTIEAILGEQTS